MENLDTSFEFSNLYRPFYLRGIPYYAGLLTGVVVDELKKREVKFSSVITSLNDTEQYVSLVVLVINAIHFPLYFSSSFMPAPCSSSLSVLGFSYTVHHSTTWTDLITWLNSRCTRRLVTARGQSYCFGSPYVIVQRVTVRHRGCIFFFFFMFIHLYIMPLRLSFKSPGLYSGITRKRNKWNWTFERYTGCTKYNDLYDLMS